ncbi:alpha/beta fold hydrolase [Arthrobacter cupressi]|uniref:Pimeloyl-ACP methyl ester carboxylesterase n=1 Tax=Arthrobacter cupressi TaxID=1045773 RepID=A0A1G8R4N4_9MICC|nr:alpha/beta fold hydrolase [Arthrobacter cupressi]NYD77869.1 pimeloyl-ACP methyl ester carboxylesterase [Arthrobacter cupressi]SDJ11370.1 Pimeloyl-ACP methyl ester carboxylesterase [Arthrobacter cupressi]
MKIAPAPDGAELLWSEAGDGEPLLLLAGQTTGMAGWGPTADALAGHFRVIRYDHRGVGGSSKGRPERYTTRLLAADAAAVLDAAGVGSAHVYGHSMGGRIAQWLAIDHPERVRALVLAGTSGGRRSGAEVDARAFEILLSGDPELMAPLFFDPAWTREHPDAVRSFFGTKASAWAKARHFQASRAHDAWDSLGTIHAPTLILHGTEDVLTPLADAVLLHRGIRRSTLVKVPGARHGLHLDHPETIAWIRQFISAK